MLRWIGNALASSIGKKVVMGLTGLLLVGYLVEHLYGNLHLFGGEEAFDGYVADLKAWGWLLVAAEIGLLALFAIHVYLAFRLTMENREARRRGYLVRNDKGAKTVSSATMFVTGSLLLAYLVKHLIDFRFDGAFHEAPAATVAQKLSRPGNALVYLTAAILVGMHVRHGFQSAFQSLGWNHPRWRPLVVAIGVAAAAVFALGYASFSIYYLFFRTQGAA
jgi:succinate dehydrogenase / fumarate reductase cytochrome b subunit